MLSVDWSREYQTISDESRSVSQMSFLDLYHKGLLERRLEPTLWDPADRTAIAQAEVEETEREGKLNYIPFAIEGEDIEPAIIATTRPELIGACGGLMIHPDHPRAGEADLIVAKHRNGRQDTIGVAFSGMYSRFSDMAKV